MEIFGVSITSHAEVNTGKFRGAKRRDIRQLIIKELSFSGKALSREQIAKAIDYFPEGTAAALRRLEGAGKIVQNRDGHWETVAMTVPQPNGGSGSAALATVCRSRIDYWKHPAIR